MKGCMRNERTCTNDMRPHAAYSIYIDPSLGNDKRVNRVNTSTGLLMYRDSCHMARTQDKMANIVAVPHHQTEGL